MKTATAVTRAVQARYRNRLRTCRLRALIVSQAELARRTGIDRTAISALENNRRFLSAEYALLFCECLDCSLDDLYERVEPQLPAHVNAADGRQS